MIHQIYCTHCTHGTSALERREGELAHRMLGYSARAGSLEARHLRRYYRQVERYVYYYLPRDTPAEEKLRLTACLAPRRLVYYPSIGGIQMIAQVCYRQTDTEGRPGSYFAHVLFQDQRDAESRWSQRECLKLWGAPGWVEEDSPSIPFLLQPLGSFGQMLMGRRPAVDDGVLLSFLATPAGGSFDDPAGVIPERWRQTHASQRSGLLAHALGGFLEPSESRRQSLLLVVEPSVAALVFYGVIRLLPSGTFQDGISFSTFEPNTDRLGTSLAATSFYDPQKTDLRPDAYLHAHFVMNTFSGRRSDLRRTDAQYAPMMVRRVLEQGWQAVDHTLADLESAGARRPEDIETLAAVDHQAAVLFDPRQASLGQDWRRCPMATGYLRQRLARQLAGPSDPGALLAPIAGRPSHLTILELIAAEPALPGTQADAEFLLRSLPGQKIADLLKLPAVSSEAKVEVLAQYVTAHAQLPPSCDWLWNEAAEAAGPRAQAVDPLLPRVLARLDLDTLEGFYKNAAERHSDGFLTGLLRACREKQSTWTALTHIVKLTDDRAILSLFRSQGPAFFIEYPEDEPALGAKLHEMVGSLAKQVRQFPERLDVILAGRHLLPDEDQNVVGAWANLRQAVLHVGRLQEQKSGVLRQRPLEELEAACRAMAEAAAKAMPSNRFDDDPKGSAKQSCLRQISQRLLGGKPLLPPGPWQHKALWQKIAWHFEHGKWSSAPLRKMRAKSRSLKSGWIFLAAVTGMVLSLVFLSVLSVLTGQKPKTSSIPETSTPRSPPATQPAARKPAEQRPVARKKAKAGQAAPRGKSAEEPAATHEPAGRPTPTRHAAHPE